MLVRRSLVKYFYIFVGIFAVLFLSAAFQAAATPPASPYIAGETLDPTCGPTDLNCYVTPVAIGVFVGSGTSGSVPFIDSSGELAEDNTALFWDETNDRLGIGTNSPATSLAISGTASGAVVTLDATVAGSASQIDFQDSGTSRGVFGWDGAISAIELDTINDVYIGDVSGVSTGNTFTVGDGYFFISGARTDVINTSGVNLVVGSGDGAGILVSPGTNYEMLMYADDPTNIPLWISLTSTQTADALQIASSSGTTLASFSASGLLRSGNGSLSTPGLSFQNDTDSGIYRAAANQIGIVTNGTERMRIDASGNVGLGDTTPDDILNISSATADAGIAITSLGTDTDPYIKFELTDGTPAFTLGVDDSDSDSFKLVQGSSFAGNSLFEISTSSVGVGLSQYSDPEAILHVENGPIRIDTYDGNYSLPTSIELNRAVGDPSSMGPLSAGEIIGEINFNGHDTVDFVNGASLGAVTTETWTPTTRGTDLVFYGTGIGVATPSELMRLTGGGRLGLGTVTPGFEVEVAGETQNIEIVGSAYNGRKSVFAGRSANGTAAGPSATSANDILAEFAGQGYGTTSFAPSSTASIRMIAEEAFDDSGYGTQMLFRTTPLNSTTLTSRMIITADGNVGISDNSPLSLFTVGTGDAFQIGSTGDIILNQATPQLTLDNNSIFNIVNEDGDNLFSLTDYNNVFGSSAESGAFVDRQSYFGEEFSRDRTSLAADGNQTWGDFQAWGVDETNNCAWEVVDDTINGIGRMRTNAAAAGNSCLTYKSAAAGNAHLEYNISNLPVIYMKAKGFGSVGATDTFWIGLGDAAAGSATAPNNGIFFTNNGGTDWVGVTRSASTQSNTACGVAISTTNFALLKIEVLSSTSVRFSVDENVSDGVSFTTCGTSATNIPATTLAAMIKSTSNATNVGVDVDFFRVWQDDNESSTDDIVLDSAPTEEEYKVWLEEKVDDYKASEGTALEELSSKLADGFAWVEEFIFNRITALVGVFDRIESRKVETEELCVGSVCVTEAEFMEVFDNVQDNIAADESTPDDELVDVPDEVVDDTDASDPVLDGSGDAETSEIEVGDDEPISPEEPTTPSDSAENQETSPAI